MYASSIIPGHLLPLCTAKASEPQHSLHGSHIVFDFLITTCFSIATTLILGAIIIHRCIVFFAITAASVVVVGWGLFVLS